MMVENCAASSSHVCLICHDESDGLHFGINACRACTAFFRRTVVLAKEYVCRKGGNDCKIHKKVRSMCRKCRLRRWLDLGILRENVPNRREVGSSAEPNESSRSPKPKEESKPLEVVDSPSSSTSGTDSINSICSPSISASVKIASPYAPELLLSIRKNYQTGEPNPVPLPVGVGEITVVPGIVEEVIRDDWLTNKGKVQHKVYMMKTPKVVQMVRAYFDCQKLEGAEIETQGGSGTAGSHWEKRVLEHETMTGASTQVFALSNITLALFEDSGWYQANYSAADSMTWGKGRGCDFVKKSCLDLVNSGVVKPFCKKDSPKFSCSDDLTQKVMCNLAQDMTVPAPYNYGFVGRFELSDWCPYYSKYEQNMNTKTDGTADSTCNHPGNMPKGTEKQYLLEIYSRASRCFELNGRPTQIKKSLTSTETRTLGEFTGCYEHKCNNGTLYVKTRHSKFYPCYYAGQLVHVNKKLVDRSRVEFDIICPPCEKLCSSCSTAPPLKLEYVGDKKTAGFKTSITMYLTLLISAYVM